MTGLIVLTAASASPSSFDPTILLTWLTCLSVIGGVLVALRKYGRKIMQMVEDFNGSPERPGVEARPGVMQRLSELEIQNTGHADKLAVIHAEVNYNHGGSIKDAVDRMDKRLEGVDGDVKFLKAQDGKKLARLDSIETTITDMHGKYLERMEGVDSDIKSLGDRTNISVDIHNVKEG